VHLLIIGGSDAGVSAALRAQQLKPGDEITVLVADDQPNFSICGLPYFLSGESPDWRALAHRTEFPGLNILRRHSAQRVDASSKAVSLVRGGTKVTVRYDRLVIATDFVIDRTERAPATRWAVSDGSRRVRSSGRRG
jgi:NADPH-dependent 2,4-dienoyl-CoA reductase/sulfur reductase-like enzyme